MDRRTFLAAITAGAAGALVPAALAAPPEPTVGSDPTAPKSAGRPGHDFHVYDHLDLIPVAAGTAFGDVFWLPPDPLAPRTLGAGMLRPYCQVDPGYKEGFPRKSKRGWLPVARRDFERLLRSFGTLAQTTVERAGGLGDEPRFPPGPAHYDLWVTTHVETFHAGIVRLSYSLFDRVQPRPLPKLYEDRPNV
jgi:hypothetical protein